MIHPWCSKQNKASPTSYGSEPYYLPEMDHHLIEITIQIFDLIFFVARLKFWGRERCISPSPKTAKGRFLDGRLSSHFPFLKSNIDLFKQYWERHNCPSPKAIFLFPHLLILYVCLSPWLSCLLFFYELSFRSLYVLPTEHVITLPPTPKLTKPSQPYIHTDIFISLIHS